jgi:flavin reductase (DIM6/NTAB) family NADH-FMN oxidoreductase RutF
LPETTDPAAPRAAFDPAALSGDAAYHLLNSIVVPRPIAWVSTLSASGVANVAPHSYCMIVSADPPIIAFSSSRAKDTLANVRARGEFVFNHVSDALAEAMNLSSADFPPDSSEFDWTGLTPVPSTVVGVPRVGESPAALECRLRDVLEFGNGPSYLIIGDVVHIAVDPDLLINGILDDTRTQPVGRLARTQYMRGYTFFDMPRPSYRGLLEAGVRPKRTQAAPDGDRLNSR